MEGAERYLFFGIAQALRERQAKFAEDNVFALYGILGRIGMSSPPPGYDKGVGRIYQKPYPLCLLGSRLCFIYRLMLVLS